MADHKDILLDANGDILIKDGDFAVGKSELQEVGRILEMSQGELKSDPVLGPGLTRFTLGPVNENKLKQLVRVHLGRDGKNYDEIKDLINLNTKTQ